MLLSLKDGCPTPMQRRSFNAKALSVPPKPGSGAGDPPICHQCIRSPAVPPERLGFAFFGGMLDICAVVA